MLGELGLTMLAIAGAFAVTYCVNVLTKRLALIEQSTLYLLVHMTEVL